VTVPATGWMQSGETRRLTPQPYMSGLSKKTLRWKSGQEFSPTVVLHGSHGGFIRRIPAHVAYTLCAQGKAEVPRAKGRRILYIRLLSTPPHRVGPPTRLHPFNLSQRYIHKVVLGYSPQRLTAYTFSHLDSRDRWAFVQAISDCTVTAS
jgi:hypothetical protein